MSCSCRAPVEACSKCAGKNRLERRWEGRGPHEGPTKPEGYTGVLTAYDIAHRAESAAGMALDRIDGMNAAFTTNLSEIRERLDLLEQGKPTPQRPNPGVAFERDENGALIAPLPFHGKSLLVRVGGGVDAIFIRQRFEGVVNGVKLVWWGMRLQDGGQ